ncbi:DUF4179 domain-containing protein [Saccharibacillus sacchari]|uniref:DUF4179 domain-containing protein n=1 Tax=Saccharibacillus sacchari TaxID=456493 RepID=A0ACC6PBR0_9BACL
MNTKLTKDNSALLEKLETTLHQQIGPQAAVREPDYDAMWLRMEVELERGTRSAAGNRTTSRTRVRKVALAATLGAALIAVPAYAAIQYDWSALLHGREGIQTALAQGLGQEIERSITHDGVTLTLHTAIIDEGRTLILYSLDGEARSDRFSGFSSITITDTDGKTFEVYEYVAQSADSEKGSLLATGYFQTDWSPNASSEAVSFSVDGITFTTDAETPLAFNAADTGTYRKDVHQSGIAQVELGAFAQPDGQTLIRTTLIPESGQEQAPSGSLVAYDRTGKPIQPVKGSMYGTPNGSGGFFNQDTFSATDLLQKGVTYKLLYSKQSEKIDAAWDFPLVLDKSKMAHASTKQKLDIRLGSGETAVRINQLTVTPAQIRIDIELGKLHYSPFKDYELWVDGKAVDLAFGLNREKNLGDAFLSIDRPADLKLTSDSLIELRARHEIVIHQGDLPAPVQLTNISGQKQSLTVDVGGYPVVWTYYKQDGNLVVQTSSEDPNFGGIGQTYIGSKRTLSDERSSTIIGDAGNSLTEVYKNYESDFAEMHIFSYIEHRPEQEAKAVLYSPTQ